MTGVAQKGFSCVYRMRERFGLTLVAQVLKGSTDKRILSLHLDSLSTYGLMKERSLADIKLLIQRFVATDYLALTESKYPVLTLQPAAYPVLRGQAKVMQAVPKEVTRQAAAPELFDHLRALRKEIALRDRIPPYVVFSDATLKDMCAVLPKTREEMLTVKGDGEHKMKKYGESFLRCIEEEGRCLHWSCSCRTSLAFSSCPSVVAPSGSSTSTSGSIPVPSMQRPLGV